MSGEQVVSTGAVDLCYESIGDGTPMVLIMGIGTQLIHWPDPLVARLADRGFRVIRFDNRDIGRSSRIDARPPDPRRLIARRLAGRPIEAPYTLSDMAADVVGLMDALDIDRAHVAGISMGGMIAQTFAIEHPDRLLSLTSMMSTPGNRRYMLAHPRALGALLGRPPRTRDEATARLVHVLRALSGPAQRFDEDEIRRIGGLAFDRGSSPAGFARQLAAIMAGGSRTESLRSVRARTLVIHGQSDPLIPFFAGRATARAIPGARFEPLKGVGHVFSTSHNHIFADLIAAHAGV